MKINDKRLILATLVFSMFTSSIPNFLSGLLLIEIGNSFSVPVAVAAQIRTASYIVSIIFAFFTGILSLRYSSKVLLQMGVSAFVIAAFGSSIASSLSLLIFYFSFTGIGFGLASSMIYTIVTKFFEGEERGKAIGWIIAGGSGSYLVGAMVVPFLQNYGGWRFVFQSYMLPCSILVTVLVSIFVPKDEFSDRPAVNNNIFQSYSKLITNKPALYSLFGYLMAIASWQAILSFNSSFFREKHLASLNVASYIIVLGALLYTVGSLISGKIAYRIGLTKYSVFTILIASLGLMVFSYVPFFLGSVLVFSLTCFIMGLYDSASTSLLTEQAPEQVSIMMSLSRVSVQLGNSIGAGLGGSLLLLYTYQTMFTILGSLGIISAFFYYRTRA